MTARKEGEVLVRKRKRDRVYALRFRAYGKRRYVTLGYECEGWTWRKAGEELKNTMADVRRGRWVPRRGTRMPWQSPKPDEVPLWALRHLLPFFADWAIDEIDVEAVDDYRVHKVRESEARARAIERGEPQRNVHGQIPASALAAID
jgi:hypothetical protein